MRYTALAGRIVALIEDLIPHSSTEVVAAATSVLMATVSALRGRLLVPWAKEVWHSLDRLRAEQTMGGRRSPNPAVRRAGRLDQLRAEQTMGGRPSRADRGQPAASPSPHGTAGGQVEPFLVVWLPAVERAEPLSGQIIESLSNQIIELRHSLSLARPHINQMRDQAERLVGQSRRLREQVSQLRAEASEWRSSVNCDDSLMSSSVVNHHRSPAPFAGSRSRPASVRAFSTPAHASPRRPPGSLARAL